jgi:hypothetical protein
LGIESEHEIRCTLQADPYRLRTGETVAFAVEKAAESSDHAYHGIERGRLGRWRLALGDPIHRLPFLLGERDVARHLGTFAPEQAVRCKTRQAMIM